MKKETFVLGFVLALIIMPFVLSVDSYVNIPNSTGNFSGNLSLQNDIAKSLSEQISIPPNLEAFTRVLFAFDNSKAISLQTFIIYMAIWIMLLIVIKSILEFIPIFGEGWKSWLGSVIVTALVSSTGALKYAAVWLFNLGATLKQTSVLWLIFDFIIIVILTVLIVKFLKLMKSKNEEMKAWGTGFKSGMPI